MMSKLASILALSVLFLAGSVHAQDAQPQIARRPYPFPVMPAAGTFSGHVMTRSFYPTPQPIPLGANTVADQKLIMPFPNGPVSGATVTVSWRLPIFYKEQAKGGVFLPPQQSWSATTGWDGAFNLANLPAGSFSYKVSHPQYATATGSFTIGGRIGATQEIYLKRTAGQIGSFAGRVTVAPRWPIFYAKPLATTNADPALAATDAQAQTDEAPLDAEEAAADKLTEPEPGATPPTAASATGAQGIAIGEPNPNAKVMPIYLGRPLANASVEVTSQPWLIPMAAGGVQPQLAPAPGSILPQPRSWHATTDASGQFSVKGLPSGRYTYRVTHKYFQPRGGSFTVGSFETDVYRTVQLERRVRGTFAGLVGEGPMIWYRDAQPTAGATTNAGATPTAASNLMPYKFSPLAGARVVAVRSRFIAWPRPLPGGPIPLAANARDAQPTAAATDAAPQADAKASAEEDAELLKLSESGGNDSAAPDDDKADAALADAEGNASAAADAAQPTAAAAPGAAPAANNLIARCIPPPVVWPTPYYRFAQTDGNGRFSISKLPAGTYRFVVRAADHQPQLGWFTVSATSPRVFRRVLLPRGGIYPPVDPEGISGQVLGYQFPIDVYYANGTSGGANAGIRAPDQRMVPVAGAQVSMQVIAAPGQLVPQVLAVATTDANGYFHFGSAAARAVLYVSANGYHPAKQEVTRGSADTSRVKIYLRPVINLPPVVGKPADATPVSGTNVEDPFSK